jgi:glycerophosphoryl diester phosphodiesterase
MPRVDQFLCIGHRGARGHAPENTLLSIDTGILLGADMIEFDVQRCEHELIVIHDPRLERTTNGSGRVDERKFAYLRSLDAGQGQQVPTLQEVLDLVEARAPLNIEIKSAGGTAARVATVLREALSDGWSPSQFLVSSFHLPELYEFKQAAPEIPIAALVCGVPLDWAACAVELGSERVRRVCGRASSSRRARTRAQDVRLYRQPPGRHPAPARRRIRRRVQRLPGPRAGGPLSPRIARPIWRSP